MRISYMLIIISCFTGFVGGYSLGGGIKSGEYDSSLFGLVLLLITTFLIVLAYELKDKTCFKQDGKEVKND